MSEDQTLEQDETEQESAPQGFDLQLAKPVEELEDGGQVVHIRDVNGEPMFHGGEGEHPVTVRVAGTYSSRYRRAQEAQTTRTLRQRSANLDGEALQKRRLELVTACVIEWDGFFDSGKPIPCTKPNVRVVLERAPWVREQVEAAMEDHLGFTEPS